MKKVHAVLFAFLMMTMSISGCLSGDAGEDGSEGPAGADRHLEMPRMVSVGAFSMSHAKAPQKVVIATEFKLLVPDATFHVGNAGGKYKLFRIVDNTNDTTTFDVN